MRRIHKNMKLKMLWLPLFLAVSACATTDIQPLTQTSFKVATTAAPACGRSGARELANKAAAIEVIRRGGDRFVFAGGQSGNRVTGMTYNPYAGFQTQSSNEQYLVVQMTPQGHPMHNDSLSARQVLGPDWQALLDEGIPNTCA